MLSELESHMCLQCRMFVFGTPGPPSSGLRLLVLHLRIPHVTHKPPCTGMHMSAPAGATSHGAGSAGDLHLGGHAAGRVASNAGQAGRGGCKLGGLQRRSGGGGLPTGCSAAPLSECHKRNGS
jgi:hypothetical protein